MNNFITIGKAIIIKGTQAVTVSAGIAVVSVLVQDGVEGLKNINLDDLLKK